MSDSLETKLKKIPEWMRDGAALPEYIIQLDTPISKGGDECTSLTLREPKGIHVRRAEQELKETSVESMRRYQFRLVSEVSGVKVTLIEEMPVSVVNRAASYLQSFVQADLETGES